MPRVGCGPVVRTQLLGMLAVDLRMPPERRARRLKGLLCETRVMRGDGDADRRTGDRFRRLIPKGGGLALPLALVLLGASSAWARAGCPSGILRHGAGQAIDGSVLARQSRAIGEPVELGCPLVSSVQPARLTIQVPYWCALPLPFRHQAEFKFKIKVRNAGSSVLNIELSHWRLLMRTFSTARWSPPQIGSPTTERPYRVPWAGTSVWAVPANANSAYDLDQRTGYASFATHWHARVLAPNETYYSPKNREGDITFYVPDTSSTLQEVVGLAYVNGGHANAVVTPAQWVKRIPAEDF